MSTSRPQGPRQRVQGVDETRPVEDPTAILRRIVATVFTVTNPVPAVGAFATLVLFTQVSALKRIRLLWLSIGASVAVIVAVLVGLSQLYFTPWRDLVALIRQGDLITLGGRLPDFIGSHVGGWLLAQLPFGLTIGFALGLLLVTLRRRWDARWRYEAEDAEKAVDARAADKTLAKLPDWPQSKTTSRRRELRVQLGAEIPSGKPYSSITAADLLKHSYIDGPSGFGKTTDLVAILRALVEAPAAQPLCIGTVLITMKPASDLTAAAAEIARRAGRNFHVITHDGRGSTTTYNPLERGTAEEIRNRLIEAEANSSDGGFSEPHYLRAGQRFTLFTARALLDLAEHAVKYDKGRKTWKRDLPHLVRLMGPAELSAVLPDLSPAVGGAVQSYVAELEADQETVREARGMRMRFAVTAEGAARNVLPSSPTGLDLEAAILAGDVVLFNLDAAADADAARQIGNLAVQDLTATMGRLGSQNWHNGDTERMVWLCVDEFSALGGTSLRNLFQRARGNGAGVTLATQESAALKQYGEDFEAAILTNSNVKILHAQVYEAENHASTWGTKKGFQETHQLFEERDLVGSQTRASGQGSLREVDQFVVHPNLLRKLRPGEAYIGVTGSDPVRVKIKDYLSELGSIPWEPADDEPEPPAANASPPPSNPWLAVGARDAEAQERTSADPEPTQSDPYDDGAADWGAPDDADMPDSH